MENLSNMKEIRKIQISEFNTPKLPESIVDRLFNVYIDKGEKVITSVS